MPVALNIEREFFAAVIAAQSTGGPKLRLGAGNMRKSMGAHHKPPASARPCSTLDLRFVNPQPVFRSKLFLSVAQKAHIRTTSRVILSDAETTKSGVLMSRPYLTASVRDDTIIVFLLFCLEIYQAEQERKRKLH